MLVKSLFCDDAYRMVWERVRYQQKVRTSKGRLLLFMRKAELEALPRVNHLGGAESLHKEKGGRACALIMP